MNGAATMNWSIEFATAYELHGHAIKRHIFSKQTAYQQVEIVDTFDYGRVLLLDGVLQSSQEDEFIYHEAIVHPALCAHPDPRDVLIIGGGEGATLREVLKHAAVQQVTMVDIDSELVAICRDYLPDWQQGAFADPRVELRCEDGRGYLQRNPDRFDCIILDLSDPFAGSPAQRLFTLEFYQLARLSLRETGILALQAESGAFKHNDEHRRIIHTLRHVFPAVLPYYTHLPLYATLFGFALCGAAALTLERILSSPIDLILEQRGVHDLRFYDEQAARGLFSPPKYLRAALADADASTITDVSPLNIQSVDPQ